MKILMVCSGNARNIPTFVKEQAESIVALGHEVSIYEIVGKGAFGYMSNIPKIKKKIKEYSPDLIHAHFGLSGLLLIFQFTIPVIITFHGCDVNDKNIRILSRIAAFFAKYVIFVEEGMVKKMNYSNKKKFAIIPCGVNLNDFLSEKKTVVRDRLKWSSEYYHVIFASAFDVPVKNVKLAQTVINELNLHIIFHELINLTRSEVKDYLNAGDLLLLTSIREGSPLIIKEALACNCPIVCTDVGDLKWVIGNTGGCFITSFSVDDVADKIISALEFSRKHGRTKGRERIIELGLDAENVANKILSVYKKVLSRCN